MAGSYPDAPGSRIAYDADTSKVYLVTSSGFATQQTAVVAKALNDEYSSSSLTMPSSGYLSVVFPYARDLDGFFVAGSGGIANLDISEDTTDGGDGTWTRAANVVVGSTVSPNYRTVKAISSTDVTGIRISGVSSVSALHLYGSLTLGQDFTLLAFWDVFLDDPASESLFDWGTTPKGSSADRSFRLKNLSADLMAAEVVVGTDSLATANPPIAEQHLFSIDGGLTFAATQTIDDVAPNAVTDVVIVRRVTPSNAVTGLWSFRVYARATSWLEV